MGEWGMGQKVQNDRAYKKECVCRERKSIKYYVGLFDFSDVFVIMFVCLLEIGRLGTSTALLPRSDSNIANGWGSRSRETSVLNLSPERFWSAMKSNNPA